MQKTLGSLIKSKKTAVAADTAIQSLAQGAELEAIVKSIDTDSKAIPEMSGAIDVTEQFLSPPVDTAPKLPSCPFFVYKGILKRLASIQQGHSEVGVMAGKEHSVLDVLLGGSVDAIIHNQSVIERWSELSYQIMGVVVFNHSGEETDWNQHLQSLDTSNELLLLSIPVNMERRVWMVKTTDGGSLTFDAVVLENDNKNRKKDATYLVINACHVSATLLDQAGHQCAAMYSYSSVCKYMGAILQITKDISSQIISTVQ